MKKHRGIRALVLVSIALMILGSLCIGVGIAKGGDLSLIHILFSSGPADVCGITKKGRLQPGYDADIVIYDPEGHQTLQEMCIRDRVLP